MTFCQKTLGMRRFLFSEYISLLTSDVSPVIIVSFFYLSINNLSLLFVLLGIFWVDTMQIWIMLANKLIIHIESFFPDLIALKQTIKYW